MATEDGGVGGGFWRGATCVILYVQHTDDDGVRKSSWWCTYRLENKNKRRGRVLAKLTIFLPLPKFQAFTKNIIYSYRWGRTVDDDDDFIIRSLFLVRRATIRSSCPSAF